MTDEIRECTCSSHPSRPGCVECPLLALEAVALCHYCILEPIMPHSIWRYYETIRIQSDTKRLSRSPARNRGRGAPSVAAMTTSVTLSLLRLRYIVSLRGGQCVVWIADAGALPSPS